MIDNVDLSSLSEIENHSRVSALQLYYIYYIIDTIINMENSIIIILSYVLD